jgi:hypothetical protein
MMDSIKNYRLYAVYQSVSLALILSITTDLVAIQEGTYEIDGKQFSL